MIALSLKNDDSPDHEAVSSQLERIVGSEPFARRDRLRLLLSHIVRESLAGNHDRLLGKNIATDIFCRDEKSFAEDLSTVRVEVGRLRRLLHQYYGSDGVTDLILIDIPKGAYTASFAYQRADDQLPTTASAESSKWPIVVSVVAVAVLVTAILAFQQLSGEEEQTAVVQPLVLIIPLQNLSGNNGNDWLALGLTTDIVNRLTKFDHILVVSRHLTGSISGGQGGPGAIGNRTDADFVLMGSMRRNDLILLVNLELMRVSDGVIVWTDAYEYPGDVENFIGLQTTIADQVAAKIAGYAGPIVRTELQASELAGAPDRSVYFCVLRLYAYRQSQSAAEHVAVRQCLEDAVEQSPDFAAAWSGLAYIYLDEMRNGFNPRPDEYEPLEMARAVAERGIKLAPDSAAAHRAMAAVQFISHEIDDVVKTAERGIALNPNDVDLLSYYGHILSISGHWDIGRRLMEKAIAMNPVHPANWHFSLALDEYRQRKFEAAREHALKITMPRFYMTHVFQAAIFGQLGNTDESKQAIVKLEETRPGYGAVAKQDLLLRNIPEPVVELLLDGLNKAGLEVR